MNNVGALAVLSNAVLVWNTVRGSGLSIAVEPFDRRADAGERLRRELAGQEGEQVAVERFGVHPRIAWPTPRSIPTETAAASRRSRTTIAQVAVDRSGVCSLGPVSGDPDCPDLETRLPRNSYA